VCADIAIWRHDYNHVRPHSALANSGPGTGAVGPLSTRAAGPKADVFWNFGEL
jgi:transposase InsO family protein